MPFPFFKQLAMLYYVCFSLSLILSVPSPFPPPYPAGFEQDVPRQPGPASGFSLFQASFSLPLRLAGSGSGFHLCDAPRDNSYCKRCYTSKTEMNKS